MVTASAPPPPFPDWIGRQETATDEVAVARVNALAATLDLVPSFAEGDEFPPGWHWILFNPVARRSALGSDGHPRRGGFMPPVELPRRMWAGGRLSLHEPLRVGDGVRRVSEIADIQAKQGKSGALVFVTVVHRLYAAGRLAIEEEHDVVYREEARGGVASAPERAEAGEWTREIRPDPVLLFRYSALTFNGHRIHYDQPYATGVEGYPGLVVHGPLIATLLMELVRERAGAPLARFTFQARAPLFDTEAFTVNGAPEDRRVRLWAAGAGGRRAQTASAELKS
ncbi:MAG: FAS1-like dehydratase domain-containing protein [Pseudomonadota bacterium]